MEVANFFNKSALAASHVLQGFDPALFVARLAATPVALAFDKHATSSPEGQATLDLAARLLARFYPRVPLQPLDEESHAYAVILAGVMHGIHPGIDVTEAEAVARLIVGRTVVPPTGAACFYIGSDGWVAKYSPLGPVGSGSLANPFGAGAAACIGVANIFRTVFADQLPGSITDEAFTLSLLSYEASDGEALTPDLTALDFEETALVGLGAIGNGVGWALSYLRGAKGILHLVDHDPIDLSNLQRYVLTRQVDVQTKKTQLLYTTLQHTGLTPVPFDDKWEVFAAARGPRSLRRAIVALDTGAARIAVQASLPQRILNAWTQTRNLGVSRHLNFADSACLACLYLPTGEKPSEDEMIAQVVKLPKDLVRQLLHLQVPLDQNLLAQIAQATQRPLAELLPFSGQTLRVFYQKAVCGGLIMGLGADSPLAETPMAFQSALAGIMLAAELVVDVSGGRQQPLPTLTRLNLLRQFSWRLHEKEQKHDSQRCICQDADFQRAYAANCSS
ncbi:E2 ligase fold family C protein [Hymenobacter coccineus]|uniref:THIF-type NAD/FAD binding fold domain-containing protein n=1 Tax=Hymenobacter coccineus TaxID=1908235 RepID=A0A1G1SSQ0_9BACT|nr:E2 ligase fold family C protein [Hymenobacter coccineus]OGX81646.1 hypothetical protein BEN49_15075 [Hymenobacter coccineus]